MKAVIVLCCLSLFTLGAVQSSEDLCALTPEQRAKAVECVSSKVPPEVKAKWDSIRATLGSSEMEAVNKLCEMRKEEKDANATKIFTAEEEAAIKAAFNDCKP